ncbi:putative zinc-binding peptidase [Blastopirellula sp. JC732]|uniref:Zinc-binding peptidase n=1 Tax=Blastopirellula sediminis TaxID=2894196 RepID=A0A9X1SFD8_9BACT|nr:putative zinc-binding peptidase [Blastopirellula sediminis]MCC9609040.1 putative zinc-binding peptidase [Blastopirellula sediminis]MCC9628183.1 putative zinc-binding peptidase [Blastopirellula sediminis]
MRLFQCDDCGELVYFENNTCLNCQQQLAFDPGALTMTTIIPVDEGPNLWRSVESSCSERYRRCENDLQHNVCNWLVPAESDQTLCPACQFTEMIPDLTDAANLAHWSKLETAKRRLLYTLMSLGLPTTSKSFDPQTGLSFHFLADDPQTNKKVLTGHADGLITLNIAEADDAEREQRRVAMGEPYRTLLGHFRHEVGHYYWDLLVRDTLNLHEFRQLFGDETADYGVALQNHYSSGPPADWQQYYVSAYASSHPWEDWAETWAHYLHMVDALEMASSSQITVPRLENRAERTRIVFSPGSAGEISMDEMINDWLSLAHMLNCANRCLGQADSYPFVVSQSVMEKLKLIHELVLRSADETPASPLPN